MNTCGCISNADCGVFYRDTGFNLDLPAGSCTSTPGWCSGSSSQISIPTRTNSLNATVSAVVNQIMGNLLNNKIFSIQEQLAVMAGSNSQFAVCPNSDLCIANTAPSARAGFNDIYSAQPIDGKLTSLICQGSNDPSCKGCTVSILQKLILKKRIHKRSIMTRIKHLMMEAVN
jgi:hypothetical protein